MGFGDLASTIIMFIAVVIVTAAIAYMITINLGDITRSASQSQDFAAKKLQTDIVIDHLYYDDIAEEVIMYVKNIGHTSLNINLMSAYINNDFFQVNSTQAPAVILPDTESVNPGFLDNNEVVQITINHPLGSPLEHTARIVTQYDITATQIFTT